MGHAVGMTQHRAIRVGLLCTALLTLLSTLAACTEAPATGVTRKRNISSSSGNAADDDDDDDDDGPAGPKDPKPGNPMTPGSGVDGGGATDSAPQTPQGPDSTKGTGGMTGQNKLKSTGGLNYEINAPAPGSKPRGLLVLLHGSRASSYATFVNMMQNVATQHDLIRVSVLAPNGQGWNEGNQVAAADLLHRLVQEDLFPKYDIDKAKVLFSGQSSGGGFLSSHFVPLHAKDYGGGAFLQCGAAPPFQTFTPDAATKQKFRLHFEITTGDDIWPQSYASAVSSYTQAGMQLSKDDTKPGGHCAFDQQAVISQRIGFILGTP